MAAAAPRAAGATIGSQDGKEKSGEEREERRKRETEKKKADVRESGTE